MGEGGEGKEKRGGSRKFLPASLALMPSAAANENDDRQKCYFFPPLALGILPWKTTQLQPRGEQV